MVLAAYFSGFDGWNAWKIFRRDSRNHASPNSAQTESVMAGALDVQLAGNAYYFGKLYEKPTIGDPIRLIEVLIVCILSLGLPAVILYTLYPRLPWLALLLESFWCSSFWQPDP